MKKTKAKKLTSKKESRQESKNIRGCSQETQKEYCQKNRCEKEDQYKKVYHEKESGYSQKIHPQKTCIG